MAENTVTKVLIAASEFEPFTSIGHLGRVVQNLSVAINRRVNAEIISGLQKSGDGIPAGDLEVRVVIPKYAAIPAYFLSDIKPVAEFDASLGRRVYPCSVYETTYCGVTIYLISCGSYFDREHVYSAVVDDVERYSCFCNAVLAMLFRINYHPDVIQCHDWQMSYIPTLYKTSRNRRFSDKNISTLYVIHSMQYQGVCSRYEMLDLLDLPTEYFTPSTLEFYGQANSLKGGLLFSDGLITVSPNHAREIQHAYYGENLEGIIRMRSSEITGIMCGIDPEIYNPASDGRIFAQYDAGGFREGKLKNKLRLQELLGLEQNGDIPIVLMISDELDYDKGADLVKFVFDDIMSLGVQVVLASRGKSDYHDFFTAKVEEYNDKVAYVCYNSVVWDGKKWIGLNNDYCRNQNAKSNNLLNNVADYMDSGAPDMRQCFHETMLFAGSDILLRPSRIEPCGEKHLIALKYGALPIVRETGGLKDVIIPYEGDAPSYGDGPSVNSGTPANKRAVGFTFFNYNAHDMLYTISRAVDLFTGDKETWTRLATAGMELNITWDAAADEYMKVYREFGGAR